MNKVLLILVLALCFAGCKDNRPEYIGDVTPDGSDAFFGDIMPDAEIATAADGIEIVFEDAIVFTVIEEPTEVVIDTECGVEFTSYSTGNDIDPNDLIVLADVEYHDIMIGEIGIDLETGEVTIPDDMTLSEASAEFWKQIEVWYRQNATAAIRLSLLREIEMNPAGLTKSF